MFSGNRVTSSIFYDRQIELGQIWSPFRPSFTAFCGCDWPNGKKKTIKSISTETEIEFIE